MSRQLNPPPTLPQTLTSKQLAKVLQCIKAIRSYQHKWITTDNVVTLCKHQVDKFSKTPYTLTDERLNHYVGCTGLFKINQSVFEGNPLDIARRCYTPESETICCYYFMETGGDVKKELLNPQVGDSTILEGS
jgi:hypothetical protein